MRKLATCMLCLALLSGCAASHMLSVEQKPQIEAPNDAATLVIIRYTALGGAMAIGNYLDQKMIGETKGYTYFVTKVPPGPHWVVATSENTAVARFDFQPGKVYILRQDIWMGFWRARTGYSPMTLEEAKVAIADCEHWKLDPNNPGEDLDEATFQAAKDGWEQGVKDDPEGYKALLEYKGN